MFNDNTKSQKALRFWDYDRLIATKEDRAAWLESEAAYIKGMIHRATRFPLPSNIRTLQIGSGPCDVIDHWHNGELHAIDPLAEEYKKLFSEFQDAKVRYIKGIAENLPYEDDYFDVIIIRNALDHVDDARKSLEEMFRVIKPRGALYVWIYLYSCRASWAYRLINTLTKRYEVEPWAFTFGRIKKFLIKYGFSPCLPAVEERPLIAHKPKDSLDWLKQTVKKVLDFKHNRGFSCVALPNKGKRRLWALP